MGELLVIPPVVRKVVKISVVPPVEVGVLVFRVSVVSLGEFVGKGGVIVVSPIVTLDSKSEKIKPSQSNISTGGTANNYTDWVMYE